MLRDVPSLQEVFQQTTIKGKTYELGHPHHPEIPHHPAHSPFLYALSRLHGELMYEGNISTANDLITTGTHTGTHIDALGHVSCNGKMHGDIPFEGNQHKLTGLAAQGVQTIEPIIRKGKIIDVASALGVDCLEAGYEITVQDLQQAIDLQRIDIQQGDAVFIRTGWSQNIHDPSLYIAHDEGAPGMSLEGARYLVELGMTLTGADTPAYEVARKGQLPVHGYLLVEKGIHIIEVMNLEEIALDKEYECIFICLPLRIIGATGSPIRPIGLV